MLTIALSQSYVLSVLSIMSSVTRRTNQCPINSVQSANSCALIHANKSEAKTTLLLARSWFECCHSLQLVWCAARVALLAEWSVASAEAEGEVDWVFVSPTGTFALVIAEVRSTLHACRDCSRSCVPYRNEAVRPHYILALWSSRKMCHALYSFKKAFDVH